MSQLKFILEQQEFACGTSFVITEIKHGEKALGVFSVEKDPIGNPPIYPVYRGAIKPHLRQRVIGHVVDYSSSYEEARRKAHDVAMNFAQTTRSAWTNIPKVIIDRTEFTRKR